MGGGGIGGIIGSVLGGVVGSVVPGVGTAIGASIGGGLGGVVGSAVSGGNVFSSLTSGALGAIGGYYGATLLGGDVTGATVAATADAGASAGAQGAQGAAELAGGSLAGNMGIDAGTYAVSQTATANQFVNLAQAYTAMGVEAPADVAAQAALNSVGAASFSASDIAAASAGAGGFDVLGAAGEGATWGSLANAWEAGYQAAPYAGTLGYMPESGNLATQYAYANVVPGTEEAVRQGSQAGVDAAVARMNGGTNIIGKASKLLTGAFSENTPGLTAQSYNEALASGMNMGALQTGVKTGLVATSPEGNLVANPIGQALNVGKVAYQVGTQPTLQTSGGYDQSQQFQNAHQIMFGDQSQGDSQSLAYARAKNPDNRQVQGYSVTNMINDAKQRYTYHGW